jgi:hypothetical protein
VKDLEVVAKPFFAVTVKVTVVSTLVLETEPVVSISDGLSDDQVSVTPFGAVVSRFKFVMILFSSMFEPKILDSVIPFNACATASASDNSSFSTVTMNVFNNEVWPVFEIFAFNVTTLFSSSIEGLVTAPENGFIVSESELDHLIFVS